MSDRLEVRLVRMPGRWVLMRGREVVAAFANRSEALAALRCYREVEAWGESKVPRLPGSPDNVASSSTV